MNPYRLRPYMDDIVVVRILKESNVLKSGIIIPDNVMQQGVQAQVVAVSAENEDLAPYANVLLYWDLDHTRTYTWEYEGDEYWVLPMDLIEAIIVREDPLPDGLAIK